MTETIDHILETLELLDERCTWALQGDEGLRPWTSAKLREEIAAIAASAGKRRASSSTSGSWSTSERACEMPAPNEIVLLCGKVESIWRLAQKLKELHGDELCDASYLLGSIHGASIEIIDLCIKAQVKVSAFFVLGLGASFVALCLR